MVVLVTEGSGPAEVERTRRTRVLGVRLTEEEYDTLARRAFAVGLAQVAPYVRVAALSQIPRAVVPEINLELREELRRIGTNLNQLAAHLNAGNLGTAEDVRRLGKLIAQLNGAALPELRLRLVGVVPEGGGGG